MLHSRFVVRSREGVLLGLFPAPLAEHALEIRDLIDSNPGAEVKSAVSTDDPCSAHPAYEVDNCPVCGRS